MLQAVTTAPKPVSPFTPAHYLTWGLISLATLGMSAGFPNHAPTFGSLFLLASTVKGYLLGVALPAPLKVVFHPIIVCSLYGSACCKLLAWVSGMGYHDVLSSYMHKVCVLQPCTLPNTESLILGHLQHTGVSCCRGLASLELGQR